MAPMMPIMNRMLIVMIRMVIWRPCRHTEFDFVLMLERPKPFTTVKWVDDASETWSKSLAFCWRIASMSLVMLSTKWFWDCCWVGCGIHSRFKSFDDFSWSLVKFSKFATLKSSEDALCGQIKFSSHSLIVNKILTYMQTIDAIRRWSLRWSRTSVQFL